MLRVLVFTFLLVFSGCSKMERVLPTSVYLEQPKLTEQTTINKTLREIPRAHQPVAVSVYEFCDLTGQHKPGENTSYSRAVTQGGVALLKQALLDAGNSSWFRVLERGGLGHLLQERKIIRSIRAEYRTASGKKLPPIGPMLYSGVLLEGGIVAYESNIVTGGVGARYLGIGGFKDYRRDIVTVALRAVSVKSGEVMVGVTTSKTIFSTQVQGGIFKYVGFDKIVEGELGYSVNEPPQLAVRQAIEMAVYSLVMEGFAKGLWSFDDAQGGQESYRKYLEHQYGETSKRYLDYSASQKVASLKNTAARLNARTRMKRPEKSLARKVEPRKKTIVSKKTDSSIPSGWYVQVASVRSLATDGQPYLAFLKHFRFPHRIQQALVKDKQYYRILVGPYAKKESAANGKYQITERSKQLIEPFIKRVH